VLYGLECGVIYYCVCCCCFSVYTILQHVGPLLGGDCECTAAVARWRPANNKGMVFSARSMPICNKLRKQRPCDGLIIRPISATDCLKDQKIEVKRSVSRMPYAPKGSNRSLKTNQLVPWNGDILEKRPVVQLLKSFPAIYGIRKFITVSTRALHWPLLWARSILCTPPFPISRRFILTLSTHLCLECVVVPPFNDTNNLVLVYSSLREIDDVIRLCWEVMFLAVTEYGNITKNETRNFCNKPDVQVTISRSS
jgi:hypothetical protein